MLASCWKEGDSIELDPSALKAVVMPDDDHLARVVALRLWRSALE